MYKQPKINIFNVSAGQEGQVMLIFATVYIMFFKL